MLPGRRFTSYQARIRLMRNLSLLSVSETTGLQKILFILTVRLRALSFGLTVDV